MDNSQTMHSNSPDARFEVQFYDFGHWDGFAGKRYKYKSAAIAEAQKMNKNTDHITRQEVFGGHRFRVRKVKS